MDTHFLDWALAAFSGYVAADELYDGPFCILSAVDNRCYKRILYDVLDHDPTHDDIRAFLRRLHTALAARDLTLRGITTDGSPLYPTPLAEVFSGVPHQLCQFHVVKDIVKAVVKAVSSERKRLAAQQPTLPRGRPRTQAAQQVARTKKRLAAQRAALFASRYLFVQRHLNKTERKTLWRVSRGLPQISYHPQSGWFEDTPLKGGTEEGCPLKGVHEGIFLLRLGSMCGTTFELLSSHRGIVCPLAVALRIALGVVGVLEAGLSHMTSSAPPQRRNGRACSSLTARGGGLPFGVRCAQRETRAMVKHLRQGAQVAVLVGGEPR